MKNNLSKTPILFVAAILVNLFLAGSCFLLWQKIIATADQINVREQEVVKQEAKKSSSYQMTALVKKEIDPARDQIAEYFVDENNFYDFIERIESLADKAQVTIEKRSSEIKGALQLGIDIKGSFSDSMYFIALIESLPINLKIDNVRTEKTPEGDSWQSWITVVLPGSGSGNH